MPDDLDPHLVVLMAGRRVGTISADAGRLRFGYDPGWRASTEATPLSLSMPLHQAAHDDAPVRAFLWGLLPDNDRVLERWAREYQVSARNPFALISHVGEDCAGAAQFVRPDRVSDLTAGEGGLIPIDHDEIARRLRVLRQDPAAWHLARSGQFSLAGAQAKTALFYDPDARQWADPWGTTPTTHILKPAISGFDDHDLNEHLCLETARKLGLPAASSRVATFGAERAIVVERYDRLRPAAGAVTRVHQEDMCQALGVLPNAKYQNEGGPSPEQIAGLLIQAIGQPVAADVVGRFVDHLAFNWLIAGTDAHAKNYSVLLAGSSVRLAPMYDVASSLPYDDMYLPKLRLAMRIGGEYRIAAVTARHWRRFATDNQLDPDAVLDRIGSLAERLPDCLADATRSAAVQELDSDLPGRLLDRITAQVLRCRTALRG
jgi:serine/threonine-protein kinase HipA